MMRAMQSRLALRLALVSLFCFALLPALSQSWFFIRPVSIGLSDENLVIVRKTPLGAVTARWRAEVFVPSTGAECEVSGENLFQPRPFDTVRFQINPGLAPCLAMPGVKVMTAEWRVVMFGWIPLHPVWLTETFGE